MDIRDFDNVMLKEKQEKFIDVVVKSAQHLKVDIPLILFQECIYRKTDEIAHIHVEERIICISNSWLKNMDFDEITETANHEVNHLINNDHGINFQHSTIDTNLSLFDPRN